VAALGLTRSRTAEAAAGGTRPAKAAASAAITAAATAAETPGAWSSVAAAARRATGSAIFTSARFAHSERAAHEELTIEALDGGFGFGALRVFHEREAARAAGLAIERANDLCRLADLGEMRPQVIFGCLIGQIAHEQSDWWHGEL
jgi:hypothetical protein